jgi:hypothetical protein
VEIDPWNRGLQLDKSFDFKKTLILAIKPVWENRTSIFALTEEEPFLKYF